MPHFIRMRLFAIVLAAFGCWASPVSAQFGASDAADLLKTGAGAVKTGWEALTNELQNFCKTNPTADGCPGARGKGGVDDCAFGANPDGSCKRSEAGGGDINAEAPGGDRDKLSGGGGDDTLGKGKDFVGDTLDKSPGGFADPNADDQPLTAEQRSQAQAALNRCISEAQITVGSCSTDRSGAMGNILDGADAMSGNMNVVNLSSVEACQRATTMSGAASSALTGVKVNCSNSYQTCSSACSEASGVLNALPSGSERTSFLADLTAARKDCNSAQTRLRGIEQNLAHAQASMQRAQSCANDVAQAQSLAQMQLQAECAANPALPQCAGIASCSNPTYAASNPSCVCQLNPTAAGCAGATTPIASLPRQGSYEASSEASGTDGSMGGGPDFGGFGAEGDPLGEAIEPSPIQANTPPSPGSFAGSGGSATGANQPGAKAAPAQGKSSFNTNVLGGRTGGGGAGGPLTTGSANGGAGTYSRNGSWIPPRMGPGVDLNKFRPKMQNVNSRLPGSLQREGRVLLGSHVIIWVQMNTRYNQMRPTLNP